MTITRRQALAAALSAPSAAALPRAALPTVPTVGAVTLALGSGERPIVPAILLGALAVHRTHNRAGNVNQWGHAVTHAESGLVILRGGLSHTAALTALESLQALPWGDGSREAARRLEASPDWLGRWWHLLSEINAQAEEDSQDEIDEELFA